MSIKRSEAEKYRVRMLNYFEELKSDIAQGKKIPSANLDSVLDFDSSNDDYLDEELLTFFSEIRTPIVWH